MKTAIAALTATASALALTLAATGVFAVDKTQHDGPVSFEVDFHFHVDDGLAEQDVFIEQAGAKGEVFRVTKNDQDLSRPLYATAKPLHHNPLDTSDIGPWQKGRDLGMTLGEWFQAEGTGSYSCENGKGRLEVEFTGLVPNGVYTMWHYFMAWPPTKPFIGTYDIPVGSRDGEQSVFKASSEGKARFDRTFKPCLQLTGEHLASGLAIAWHSDGKTYGVLPGEFATRSHIQLYSGLPQRSGL